MKARWRICVVMVAMLLCTAKLVFTKPQEDRRAQTPRRGPPVLTVEQFQKLVPPGVTFVPDISYREGNESWKLDLVMPEARGDHPRPGIVFIHDGGWMYGNKRGAAQSALRYAQKGYVCISVSYRLTGEAAYPACIQDVRCAVRWFSAHAEQYNVDENRIGGFDHSAGVHLAAFLGVAGPDPELDDGPYSDQSSLLNAVCSVATPTDFTNWHRPLSQQQSLLQLLVRAGPEETLMERTKTASPITHVTGSAPPFLLIHGTEDRTVDPSQPKRFAQALWDTGARDISLLVISGTGHSPNATDRRMLNPLIKAFCDTTIGSEPEDQQEDMQRFEQRRQQNRPAVGTSGNTGQWPETSRGDPKEPADRTDNGKVTHEGTMKASRFEEAAPARRPTNTQQEE